MRWSILYISSGLYVTSISDNPRSWGIDYPSPDLMKQQEIFREVLKNWIAGSQTKNSTSSFPDVGGFCPHRYHWHLILNLWILPKRIDNELWELLAILITHDILFLSKMIHASKGGRENINNFPGTVPPLILKTTLRSGINNW